MFQFSRIQRRRTKASALRFEALEMRIVPAAILVASTPGPGSSVNLTITGTDGDDDVQIYVAPDNLVHVFGRADGSESPAVILNGAPAQQELVFAKVNSVTMNLGGGNDLGLVRDVSARRIVFNDGLTAEETNGYTVLSQDHAMTVGSVRANIALGTVSLTVSSGNSLQLGSLTVMLGNTTSSEIRVLASDSASLRVAGLFRVSSSADSTSRDQLIIYSYNSGTPDAGLVEFGNVLWQSGGGNDLIYAAGAMRFVGSTNINSGSGDDSVEFVGGFSELVGCPTFFGRVTVNTGAGKDVFGTNSGGDSSNRVTFMKPIVVMGGTEADYVYSSNTNYFSSLGVHLGNTSGTDADRFWSSDVQVHGATTIRSAGLAQVLLQNATSASQFHGNASFILGSGFIYVGVDIANTKVIFDAHQTFRGILEPLSVYYFGDVQANPAKRRLINAVVQ